MSDTATLPPDFLIAVCPTCSEIRYRSKFPIAKAEDCRPESFDGVGDSPPTEGQAVPLCYACGAVLRFTREGKLTPKADAKAASREQLRAEAMKQVTPEPLPIQTTVQTLFEAAAGEDVKAMYEQPGAVVIVTSRRIVRVTV